MTNSSQHVIWQGKELPQTRPGNVWLDDAELTVTLWEQAKAATL